MDGVEKTDDLLRDALHKIRTLEQTNKVLRKEMQDQLEQNAQFREEMNLLNQAAVSSKQYGRRGYRIIAIDGGGLKATIPSVVLQRLIAARSGLLSSTDLYVGTSTGAIVASMLATGHTADDAVQLFIDHGPLIFGHAPMGVAQRLSTRLTNLVSARFKPDPLHDALRDAMGYKALSSVTANLVMVAVDIEHQGRDAPAAPPPAAKPAEPEPMTRRMSNESIKGPRRSRRASVTADTMGSNYNGVWRPKLFHNLGGSPSEDDLVDCILSSSAAPTVFPIHRGFVDGSLAANNPCMVGLCMAQKYENAHIDDIRILSLGTGLCKSAIRCDFGGQWAPGLMHWVQDMIGISIEMNTQMPLLYSKFFLGEHVFRLNAELEEECDPWDGAGENIEEMMEIGRALDLVPAFHWIDTFWTQSAV